MYINPSVNRITVNNNESSTGFVFFLFCLWAFVILSRPQDLFPVLGQFRPALTMGILTMGFVVLRLKDLPGPPLFQERQIKYLFALFIIMILGIPWSMHSGYSFERIFMGYIVVILFVFVFYKLVSSVDRLYTVLLLGCLGTGLYSAFALSKFAIGSGRLQFGGMFDPNDIAFFVLGFLPLNLIFISRDNPLWIRLACLSSFGMGVLIILHSGSRAGFLALVVVAILLLLRKSMTVKFSLKAVFVAMLIIIASFVPIDTERYSTILAYEKDYNIQAEGGRKDLWKFGIRSMFENPLTGVGVGCYGRAIGLDRQARGDAETRAWQAPHNSIIQIGSETGVIGLTLFLILSLNVLRVLNKAKKISDNERLTKIGEMGLIGFAGLFISGLFLSHGYSFYFAFYFVIAAVVSQMLINKQQMSGGQQA